jgi:crossover junction endodeoxyribonuclease RuvC
MIILGIDPGLSGALAFLNTMTGEIAVEDMPTVTVMRNRKEKREVSAQLVAAIVVKRHVEAAFLEKVNAMAGQGVSSVFSFGRSAGIIEGVLAAFDIPTTLVTPQAWQKAMASGTARTVAGSGLCSYFRPVRSYSSARRTMGGLTRP